MSKTVVEREIGGRTLRFETGQVAKLASGSVMASYADTVVLATCVRSNPRPGIDFFPLQCDYRERTSAAGRSAAIARSGWCRFTSLSHAFFSSTPEQPSGTPSTSCGSRRLAAALVMRRT